MFIIIQYSRGNTLLLESIEKLLAQSNHHLESLRFILLEMNGIENLQVNAVCEVSRYLKFKLDTSVVVTNNIETFDYDEYLNV